MNLSRCDKGHFYDKEKYATCPHCQGGEAADDVLTSVFTEDMTSAAPTPLEESTPPIGGIPADQPTMGRGAAINETKTVPLTDSISSGNNFVTEPVGGNFLGEDDDNITLAFYDDIFADVSGAGYTQPVGQGVPVNPITSPCVGWLVALGGVHVGQDYHLKVGKNFIGRDTQMDIPLTGDKSVSRYRHAIIVYEPKQHLYLVQPGESSGLVYRNDEVVLSPVKLEAYDMLTVGEVNLLFMPLCGERFNWSTLLEELSKKDD